jgi:tetratricopeptide (TPR) repeat protein
VKIDRASALLLLLLLAGTALRSVGFSRGASDFVLPEEAAAEDQQAFYAFHPDEISLLDAALRDIDLLRPPYTSYGTLPPYLLGGLLRLFDLQDGRQSLTGAPAEFRQGVYLGSRALSILFSLGVLLFTCLLAHRLYGAWAAAGATGVVAFAPGAIQQAHFFIADGPFALMSLVTLWAIHRAGEQTPKWSRFLLAGVCIGLAACVRFNGALLGLLLVGLIALRCAGSLGVRLKRTLGELRLWVAGAVALALLLSMHPFLVLSPELISRSSYIGDIGLAMKFASGQYLQPWTLVDVGVIPYVSHWFGMWPLIVGWPLTIGFLGALIWAGWRGGWRERLLLAWCLLYLLPVGLLPVRAVRHLVPLLPVLTILTAGATLDVLRVLRNTRQRQALAVIGLACAIHLFLYGTGFARIYLAEDSRIRAGRFLAEKVRPSTYIGVESGAFSAAGLVSTKRHRHLWMDMSMLLYAGPYMLCTDRVDFLQKKLELAGAIVYAEENRAVQYATVPELFPVAASFYEELSAGHFGFDVVRRFKTYPEVAGILFGDDGVDPTFNGYDHPAVNVLLRRDDADFATAFGRWRQSLTANPYCPDRALQAAAVQLAAGREAEALAKVRTAIAANPNALIAYRLEAEVLRRQGDRDGVQQAMSHFDPEMVRGRMAHVINPNMVHFVTAASALSLVRLGLYEEALKELQDGVGGLGESTPRALNSRARSYLRVANAFGETGHPDYQRAAARMSLQVYRTADACNALARITAEGGDLRASRQFLEQSIMINARQPDVHLSLGELYLTVDPDYDRALFHLNRAAELDAALSDKVQRLRGRLHPTREPTP